MALNLAIPDDEAPGGVSQDGLQDLINKFLSAEEASDTERQLAERDRDYVDGHQWTAEQISALSERGQAAIVINRMRRKHNWLMGSEVLQRTDPKAFPRTPAHEDAAEAATDGIRFVAENNNYDTVRSEVWDNMIVEGFGGCEVSVAKKRNGDVEIQTLQIPWDRLFRDPHSRKKDFSDATFMGYVVWMDHDRAKMKWPDAADAFDTVMSQATVGETFDDRPKHTIWADTRRRRVRIVQMYFLREDVWHQAIFTAGRILSGNQPVEFLDEEGVPENPLILQSAYVDRENRRYGEMRELIGPQDEINHRRSKALYMLSARQVIAEEDAVKNVPKAKSELTKADGYIEVERNARFEVNPTNDMADAQFSLLQEAKAEIDGMGPNASLQGKQPQALSGRALLAQQQGGSTELSSITDARRQFDLRVYRQVWNRIRQYWTAERWVRVTDDEDKPKFVGLNQPRTRAELVLEGAEQAQVSPEEMQQIQFMLQLDPSANDVVEIQNNVAELDVDIILEDVPDNVTLQHEQFMEMAKLAQGGLAIPPDLIVEASSLRNKNQILERMRGNAEQQEAQAAMAAQERELQERAAVAQITNLEAEAQKTTAEVGKVQAETEDELASAAQRRAQAGGLRIAR